MNLTAMITKPNQHGQKEKKVNKKNKKINKNCQNKKGIRKAMVYLVYDC